MSTPPRPVRRSFLPLLLAVAIGLAAFPLGVLASHQFGDVPTGHPFHADIDAIADAGVTSGCGGGNFCPERNVTRGEMAAFMNRLGALAPGKVPVVNAAKLDGLDSTDFLAAGPVVMAHDGAWVTNTFMSFGPATFGRSAAATLVVTTNNDEIWVQAGLAHPETIGSVHYALQSVEVCWTSGSTNVSIFHFQVAQTAETTGLTLLVDEPASIDPTAGAGCQTWETDVLTPSAGNTAALLALSYSGAGGTTYLGALRSTWVPVP